MRIIKDALKFKVITESLTKNGLIFIFGLLFFVMTYRRINMLDAALGLISLLVSYSAVYPFNDINDVEYDKKDSMKKVKNPISSGKLKIGEAASLIFFLLIVGFLFSITLNLVFKIFLFIALFFNFINSSKHTVFHNRSPVIKSALVFPMQFSKFAMGWFSQTMVFVKFPFVIGFVVSLTYSVLYYIYKRQIFSWTEFFKCKKFACITIFLCIISIVLVSIFLEFKFLMFTFVALFLIGGTIFKIWGFKNVLLKSVFFFIYFLIIVAIIASIHFYSISPIPHKLDEMANNNTEKIRITIEDATNSTLNEIIYEIQKIAIVQNITNEINKTIVTININDENG